MAWRRLSGVQVVTGLLLGWAAFAFLMSSPLRPVKDWVADFSPYYAASRTWLHGGNPYDILQVLHTWDHAGPAPYRMYFDSWTSVNPPSTLVALTPFALLPTAPAHYLWFFGSLALAVAAVYAMGSMAGFGKSDTKMKLLLAALLASAPAQGALASGQTGGPAVALILLAMWCVANGREGWGGLLLGIATALKLQLGGPFILYYALLRRWRTAEIAAMISVGMMLIGIMPLEMHGYHWFSDWMALVADTVRPGGMNDMAFTGPYYYQMVNLQVVLNALMAHGSVLHLTAVHMTVFLIVAGLAALFVANLSAVADPAKDLLALGMFAAINLLPVYHRTYDAMILLPLVAWGIAHYDAGPWKKYAQWTLVLMLPFVLPQDLGPSLTKRTHLLDSFTQEWWWRGVFMPKHAWAMLILCGWGVVLMGIVHHRRLAAVELAEDGSEAVA